MASDPPQGSPPSDPEPSAIVETMDQAIRLAVGKFPKPVRLRAMNALDHIDRADRLLEFDREMASFRAITAEEEAAAAVFKALQWRSYPNSKRLSERDHVTKAALLAVLTAIRESLSPLDTIKVVVDWGKPRLDVLIPLSAFGIGPIRGEALAVQPVEPLDLYAALSPKDGAPARPNNFERELKALAEGSKFDKALTMIRASANARNMLLYASDTALPKSKATAHSLRIRRQQVMVLLGLTIAVLQTRKHQKLAVHVIEIILELVKRSPLEPCVDSKP